MGAFSFGSFQHFPPIVCFTGTALLRVHRPWRAVVEQTFSLVMFGSCNFWDVGFYKVAKFWASIAFGSSSIDCVASNYRPGACLRLTLRNPPNFLWGGGFLAQFCQTKHSVCAEKIRVMENRQRDKNKTKQKEKGGEKIKTIIHTHIYIYTYA